jgi:hypothetical protein
MAAIDLYLDLNVPQPIAHSLTSKKNYSLIAGYASCNQIISAT